MTPVMSPAPPMVLPPGIMPPSSPPETDNPHVGEGPRTTSSYNQGGRVSEVMGVIRGVHYGAVS